MPSIISELAFLEKITKNLIKPRPLNYSEECLNHYVNEEQFTVEDLNEVKNFQGFTLKTTLIKHSKQKTINTNTKCIIFLHGLGSSRLQGLPIVSIMPNEYCLCLFDSCGNGKSQGDQITYGMREQYDIDALIQYIAEKKGIQQFVLWGRSMGAVSILLYTLRVSSQSSNIINVECIVVDSPFYSFTEISRHIAYEKMSIPNFISDIAINVISESFEKLLYDEPAKKSYNPFQIDFNKELNSIIPAVFICSQKDEIVPIAHSYKIMANYKYQFLKIIMENTLHNQSRGNEVLKQVFDKIKILTNKINQRNLFFRHAPRSVEKLRTSSVSRKKGIEVFTPSKNKQAFVNNALRSSNASHHKKTETPHKLGISRLIIDRQDNIEIQIKRSCIYSNNFKTITTPEKKNKYNLISDLKMNQQQSNFIRTRMKNQPSNNQNQLSLTFNTIQQRTHKFKNKRFSHYMCKVEPRLTHNRYL